MEGVCLSSSSSSTAGLGLGIGIGLVSSKLAHHIFNNNNRISSSLGRSMRNNKSGYMRRYLNTTTSIPFLPLLLLSAIDKPYHYQHLHHHDQDQDDYDLIINNNHNNAFILLNHQGNLQSDDNTDNGAIGSLKSEAHLPGKTSEYDENDEKKIEKPSVVTYSSLTGGGGTRAGLFRTPISGGVQSATSAHGLPRPALAVRNLMEQARFAHLCTVMSQMHHRREGYPFGSLVDFGTDSMGHPIFSFSPLAIHTRNLLKDPRCSLVVQIPGWSGLSNARVTIVGDVLPLSENQQEWAHKQYIAKHQQGPSQQWGNFYYFRMQNITDIYFIGGFGTVAWVDVKEYEDLQPDKIAVDGGEQNLKELNATFSKPLKELLSAELEVDDAALISIDSKGIDIRVRQGAQFNIQRISFEEGHAVETLEEAKSALWKLIEKGRVYNMQK